MNDLLKQAQTAPNAQAAADAYAKMRDLLVQSAGGLDKLTTEQGAFVHDTVFTTGAHGNLQIGERAGPKRRQHGDVVQGGRIGDVRILHGQGLVDIARGE